MSTLSEMQVIDFPGFPTAVVRSPDQATAGLAQFMDTAFRALGAALQEGAVTPAGRLAVAKHTGPYDLLPEAWGAFLDALCADGHEPEDLCWESYETRPTPDVDPETLVTGLAVRVRDAR